MPCRPRQYARSRRDDRSTERGRRCQVRRLKHAGGAWRPGAHRRRICEAFQRGQLQADKDHSNGHEDQFDRRSSFLGRACIIRNFAGPAAFRAPRITSRANPWHNHSALRLDSENTSKAILSIACRFNRPRLSWWISGAWPATEAAAPCGDFRWRMKCGLDMLTESLSAL